MAGEAAAGWCGWARGCGRGLLAGALALPTYLVVLPLLLILRGVFYLLCDVPCQLLCRLCGKRQGRRTPMRSEDAFMFMETDTNRCNIVAAIELDGPPLSLPELTALVDQTVVSQPRSMPSGAADSLVEPKWPRFKQRPVRVWGYWFWEDVGDGFDLSSHVWEESSISDERALAGLLARLQSEAMDPERPVWDVVLARPGTRAGGTTVIFRLHHSMGDGISLVRVLLEALDGGANPAAVPPAVGHRSGAQRGRFAKLLELGSHLFYAPLFAVEQLFAPFDRNALKPGTLAGVKHAALTPAVELQRIKAIARAHDSTVSAVMVACFARALAGVGGATTGDRPMKFWVPVSLSSLQGPAEMRNDLIFIMMPMPVGAQSAAAALSSADAHMRSIKTSYEAPALWLILRAAMLLLPFSIAHPFLNFLGDKASGVFSSVPGPTEPLRWGGARVAGLRFLVPQRGGFALGLSVVSYCGTMRAAVSADAAALTEPGAVAEGWLAALQELEASVKAPSQAAVEPPK